MRTPTTVIVTVNYNGWRDTLSCLDSLLGLDTHAVEIVIVDNGSHDGSSDRLSAWLSSRPDVELLSLHAANMDPATVQGHGSNDTLVAVALINSAHNLGFSAANNIGIRYAELRGATYVWLLNNDTTVAPDSLTWLERAAEEHGNHALLSSRIRGMHDKSDAVWFEGAVYNPWIAKASHVTTAQFGSSAKHRYLSGCALLVPMKVVSEVGRLDERLFLYGEDIDYCIRAMKVGIPLRIVQESNVAHKGSASAVPGSPAAYRYYVMNFVTVVCRHHGIFMLFGIIPYHLTKAAILLLSRRRPLRAISAYLRGLSQGIVNGIRERFIPAIS